MSSPQAPPPDQQAPAPSAQTGLTVALALALAQLWPSLNLADLRSSLPAFTAAVTLQVQRHALVSAALAARDYTAQRRAAGITSGFTPRPADPPPVEQVAQMVDWATQPLWNRNAATAAALLDEQGRGRLPGASTHDHLLVEGQGSAQIPKVAHDRLVEGQGPAEPTNGVAPTASQALEDAQQRLEGASQRLVADTGRRTTIEAAAVDPKASGYYREPQGDHPCYFCAMLATRGPVYKQHSYDRANAKFIGDGRAKTHDHCDCEMKPYFGAHHSWEPTGKVAEWERQYASATAGVYGMKDAQLAFRRAYEGRTAPTK